MVVTNVLAEEDGTLPCIRNTLQLTLIHFVHTACCPCWSATLSAAKGKFKTASYHVSTLSFIVLIHAEGLQRVRCRRRAL